MTVRFKVSTLGVHLWLQVLRTDRSNDAPATLRHRGSRRPSWTPGWPVGPTAPALHAGNPLLLATLRPSRRVDAGSGRHLLRGSKRQSHLDASETRGRNSPRKPRGSGFPAPPASACSAACGVCAGAVGPTGQPGVKRAAAARADTADASGRAACRQPAHATDGQRHRRRMERRRRSDDVSVSRRGSRDFSAGTRRRWRSTPPHKRVRRGPRRWPG
jgi:hypothetical protein